jgi:TRAP-type C4-dicarboxylate transport system substrate-binding protein
MGQEMELLGAAPISLQPSDVYQSMQRGVIDGLLNSWTAVQTFKLHEVTSHHLEVPLGQSPAFVIFNKDSYAKLPAKARTAIDKSSGEVLSRRLGKATDGNRASGRAMVVAMKDHTISGLDAAETERWRARLQPVIDDWLKATPDGARVLAAFREELAKVRAGR